MRWFQISEMKRILGILSGLLGLSILIYVIYPIAIYEILSRVKYAEYILPVPQNEKYIYSEAPESGIDYTKASNWFSASATASPGQEAGVRYYSISIPELKIKNATVSVGGEDLAESLIQYPGTALPGKVGNTVVFGHSVLPQFFNPKDYLTIFSTLPQIKKGDLVRIDFDGISYEYEVEDTFEVSPSDVEILSQNASASYVTLVTCVPPGHPLRPKRLIVRAKIVPPDLQKIYEISRN